MRSATCSRGVLAGLAAAAGYGRSCQAVAGCCLVRHASTILGGLLQPKASDTISTMTKMMQQAIEVLRELPEERQEVIVRAILSYVAQSTDESSEV